MKRSTIILLAAVAVLVLLILFWEKKQPSTAQKKESAEKIFASFPEKIVKIERTGFDDVKIEKAKDDWQVKSPIDDPADNSSVEGFLESLKGAQASRMIEKAPPANLGLTKPKITITLTGDKGEKLLLELGDQPPLEQGTYFRCGEKIGIIGEYLIDTIKKGVNDFRSRELAAPLKPDEVKAVAHIIDGRTVASLENRNGRWFVVKPYEDEADANKAYFFFEDVVLWPVMTFDGEITDLSSAGLLLPKERIEITTLDGARVTVAIGDLRDAEKKFYYASVSNRKGVFTVSRNSVRILDKDPEELRSLTVCPPELYNAEKVEITSKIKVILKNTKEKGWEVEGEAGRGEEAKAVVYSLNDLRAEKLLPPENKGTLLAEITAVLKDGRTEVKLFEENGILYAVRSGRNILARISSEDGERLKAAIAKLEEKKK